MRPATSTYDTGLEAGGAVVVVGAGVAVLVGAVVVGPGAVVVAPGAVVVGPGAVVVVVGIAVIGDIISILGGIGGVFGMYYTKLEGDYLVRGVGECVGDGDTVSQDDQEPRYLGRPLLLLGDRYMGLSRARRSPLGFLVLG